MAFVPHQAYLKLDKTKRCAPNLFRSLDAKGVPAAMSSGTSSKVQEQDYELTEYGSKRYNICGMRFETTPNYFHT